MGSTIQRVNTLVVDNSSLIPEGDLGTDPLADVTPITPLEQFCLMRFKKPLSELSPKVHVIVERMEEYINRMNGKVVIYDNKTGAENQVYLINTILRALGYDQSDLYQALDVLLFIMYDNRDDTFRNEMAFRFMTFIRRGVEDIDAYSKFLEIFMKISNPVVRANFRNTQEIQRLVATIPQSYRAATFNLVSYLTQP